jgi:uncharacterized protein YndB with AHSA1/START domain
MKDSQTTQDIIAQASVFIKAPVERIWKALMDPEALRKFMFGARVESGWQEGDSIRWKGEWQGTPFEDKGKVLEVEPYQLLQYSHFSPLSGAEDIPSNYHVVTITLTKDNEGVWVALTQDKNENAKAREHSEKNWKMMLDGLKEYVEHK